MYECVRAFYECDIFSQYVYLCLYICIFRSIIVWCICIEMIVFLKLLKNKFVPISMKLSTFSTHSFNQYSYIIIIFHFFNRYQFINRYLSAYQSYLSVYQSLSNSLSIASYYHHHTVIIGVVLWSTPCQVGRGPVRVWVESVSINELEARIIDNYQWIGGQPPW